jgi:hypothetical protein
VKWEDVCKPKRFGGLGVRDLRVVNISLLTKWRWRLLDNNPSLWKNIIRSKYGEEVIGTVVWGDGCRPWFSSLWWKDLCSIGFNLNTNWFAQGVIKNVGNGVNTRFWLDTWIGDLALKERYPRLFSISTQKQASVAEIWSGEGGSRWNLIWRRRLFVWEGTLLEDFVGVLQDVNLTAQEDSWRWKYDTNGVFSVKSTYTLVFDLMIERGNFAPDLMSAFRAVWKGPTPSKVQGFVWMMLLDRIPTKSNLFRRGVLQQPQDQVCVLCGSCVENSIHLFIYCTFAIQVWDRITNWLGLVFTLPQSCASLLNYFAFAVGNKKSRSGLISVWNAATWCLWRHRNKILFENGTWDLSGVVDEIKVMSWKWWIERSNSPQCLLYEWYQEPALCLLR